VTGAAPFLALLLGLAACEGGLFAPASSDSPIRTTADEYVLETTSVGWQTEISFDEDARPFGPTIPREQRISNEFRLVIADAPTD
jgi:hypothetical protein